MTSRRLRALPGDYAIARLAPDDALPGWADQRGLTMVARSAEELSILVEARFVPEGVRSEGGWRAFVLAGPFEFTLTGVLASVLVPLAEVGVPILAMSTFDTDYVFVKHGDGDRAMAAWRAAGHTVDHEP